MPQSNNHLHHLKKEVLPQEGQCIVQEVSTVHMFNLLQDMAITMRLVCDMQPTKDDFDRSHARASTFVEYTPEDDDTSLSNNDHHGSLLVDRQFRNKQLKMRELLYKEVLLYGEHYRVRQLAHLLAKENRIQRVYFLECDYSTFQKRYPFACSTPERKAHQRSLPAEIVPNFLYLGNFENAKSREQLDLLGITHVLNMAEELDNVFESEEGQSEDTSSTSDRPIQYLKIHVGDTTNDAEAIAEQFPFALDWIERAREEECGNKVLVHCNLGISRSSTITIAWLMKHYQMRFQDCLLFVKSMRCFVSPNESFMEQLKLFESSCLEGCNARSRGELMLHELIAKESAIP